MALKIRGLYMSNKWHLFKVKAIIGEHKKIIKLLNIKIYIHQ